MPERLTQDARKEHIAQAERDPYEGYPQKRLVIPKDKLVIRDGLLHLPEHESEVNDHPNREDLAARLDPIVPSGDRQKLGSSYMERWKRLSLDMDQHHRPLHPNWQELLTDPRIGVFTGPGFYYFYGPNGTSDAAKYRRPHDRTSIEDYEWLLIKRRKEGNTADGKWALPGGFGDPDDGSAIDTALREAHEETGLKSPSDNAQIIQQRRPAGRRTTLNSWTENTLVLVSGDQAYLHDVEPFISEEASKEVTDVGWFTRGGIAKLQMYTYHTDYVDLAISSLARLVA